MLRQTKNNKPLSQHVGNVCLIYGERSVLTVRRRRLAEGTSASGSSSADRLRDVSADAIDTADVSELITTDYF
ncbi:unnamed protein product [Gongylonema pulchrum]|uniref:Kinesin motor domain-containing protein n=1 Tax=Gongylonema pulchrum TaxID=637853 RepID=A0A183ERW7_9BILA|nr:unnamed protein product [Gongylonema pulchrum]